METLNSQMNNLSIKIVDFTNNFNEIKEIRTTVFIQEQHVPVELEWDEFDEEATHVITYFNNKPVATARLLKDGHIGRMAVLKAFRNRKIGQNMLKYILELAKKRNIHNIQLSAQKHAVDFYRKYGFSTVSNEYMDAGIPHYDMKYLG